MSRPTSSSSKLVNPKRRSHSGSTSSQRENHTPSSSSPLFGGESAAYSSFQDAVRTLNKLAPADTAGSSPAHLDSHHQQFSTHSSSPPAADWSFRCAILEGGNDALKRESDRLRAEIQKNESEYITHRDQLRSNHMLELEELKDILAHRNARVAELEEQTRTLSSRDETIRHGTLEMETKLENTVAQLRRQEDQICRARMALKREAITEMEIKGLKAQRKEMVTTIAQLEAKNRQQESRIVELEQYRAQVACDPVRESNLLDELKSQLDDLAARSNEQLVAYEREMMQMKESHTAELSTLKKKLKRSQTATTKLRGEHDENDTLQQEVRSLRTLGETERHRYDMQVNELKERLRLAADDLLQSQAAVRKLEVFKSKYETCDSEITVLVRRLGRAEATVQSSERRIHELEHENRRLQGQGPHRLGLAGAADPQLSHVHPSPAWDNSHLNSVVAAALGTSLSSTDQQMGGNSVVA